MTFGIGHKIISTDPEDNKPCGTTVTTTRVIEAFDEDTQKHVKEDCYKLYDDFDCQPDFVQHVVGDMMFNIGLNNFTKFVNMKAAVLDKGPYLNEVSKNVGLTSPHF